MVKSVLKNLLKIKSNNGLKNLISEDKYINDSNTVHTRRKIWMEKESGGGKVSVGGKVESFSAVSGAKNLFPPNVFFK